MDDGHPDRSGFIFNTNNFTLEEVQLLANVLKKKFDLNYSHTLPINLFGEDHQALLGIFRIVGRSPIKGGKIVKIKMKNLLLIFLL